MSNNSLDDMYKWLAVEPRTRGWNAILAFDRTKTNTVLLQEYINRFSTGDYLKPITELLADNETPTHREYLVDYVMDAPRLSFIDSNLEDSKARSRQKVMGGTHMVFERPMGAPAWRVTKVALWGPIDGPTLEYDIDLKATQGDVGRQGTVSLNIAEGRNYRMTYAETEHLATVTGERLCAYFSKLPESQKNFVLNEITIDQDQLLKPVRFLVRTHNKKGSGATLAANENEEEGAVLLFVTMEGQSDGERPAINSDLKYLLPDGLSATLLLGHRYFYDKVIVSGMRRLLNQDSFQYEYEMEVGGKSIRAAYATTGARTVHSTKRLKIDNRNYISTGFNFSLDPPGGTSWFKGFQVVDPTHGVRRRLVVQWMKKRQLQFIEVSESGDGVYSIHAYTGFHFQTALDLAVDPATMDLVFTYPEGAQTLELDFDLSNQSLIPPAHLSRVTSAYASWLENYFADAVKDYTTVTGNINVLMLNSLLFRGKNRVQPQHVNFLHDLAIFGQVGPTLTAFTLNNLEPVLGRNDTFYFETLPKLTTNVDWKVESVPGSNGKLGSINPKGVYTAPGAGDFEGDYMRVRVIATAGGNSSSALVTVLRYDMAINPLVQVVGAGDAAGREVSAGALNSNVLDWSVGDPSTGAEVKPSIKEGGDHTYYPGPRSDDRNLVFSLDQIIVTNPRNQKTEQSVALVLHQQPNMTITILPGSGGPANQVRLQAAIGDYVIDPEEEDLSWAVFAGSGRVDPKTGVFTVDPFGAHKFAVVTAHIPGVRGRPSDDGFIILPIPLYAVPDAIGMLTTDQMALSAE
ncbi:hypothetical protein [Pseudomonas sp. IT-P176]|uniref:hypothetical protein n=1 Tax=Pseudomonas sp. IT-P176 TaxID=3026444 RepID=UPI0039E11DFF